MKEMPLIENVVNQIRESGKQFNTILCCGRGGLVPAAFLAHRLGIKTVIHLTNARETPTEGLRTVSVTSHLLVVDDISDTGETFKSMTRYVKEGFSTAALYERHSTAYPCDFVGERLHNEDWVDFTWEEKQ